MKIVTSASIFALACGAFTMASGTAFAQSAQPDASDNDSGDIIVTAQRRSQRLVDVPISVATASPDDLERAGPTSVTALTKITPGVYFQRAAYGLSPTIRGIGSTLSTQAVEQIVALYVDNIYYPAPTGNIFDLASVAGVEILKGPQGTLFGRNATGGALLVRTLDPDFTPAGRFNISYERFSQIRSSAYVNIPLGDKVAFNASVAYRYSRGYARDVRTGDFVNEGRNFSARTKLLVQPTDNLSAVFTFMHSNLNEPGVAQNLRPAPVLLLSPTFGPIATDRRQSSRDTPELVKTQAREYSARIKLDTDIGTISSYSALLRNKLDTLNDLDQTYFVGNVNTATRAKTFTQEVNLTSLPDQPLNYVAGVYYFRNRILVPFLLSNGSPLVRSYRMSNSIAFYADGTYKLGDLSIIAGLRYSIDKRGLDSTVFNAPAPFPRPFFRTQRTKDKQWTPRLGLRYSLAERTNVYATYSKGFKAGEFDGTTANGPGVRPETVDAFEVGFKHAGPGITFNTAAYYYKYKDTQVNATVSGNAGAIFSQLFNVPKSRIWGIEADGTYALSDNFDIRAAVAYTNAKYVDFKFAPGFQLVPTVANPNPLTFANISVDVSGRTMVRAPKITASGTFIYHAPIADDKELEVSVAPYYSSRVYFTFDNTLSQKPYFTLDASATLKWGENVKLSVFGRNLTDTKYANAKSQNALSLETIAYALPRVYGVSMGYSF